MAFATIKLPIILFGAAQLLKHAARRHPKFKARVKEHNLVAQIMTRDEEIGRWFAFNTGTREIRAIPTYHPAFLLRSPLQKRLAWRDFLAIKKALASP